MAKFTFDESKAAEASGGETGKKVLDTGVYTVTLNTVSEVVASTGTIGIDWNLTVDGAKYPNIVYGMWVQKADGTDLFGMNILQSLMGILGVKELTQYDKTIEIKDGTKVVKAFKELDGKRGKVAIQKVLDYYNGEVREKNEIKAFFNEDGQTYAEMKKGIEPKQIKWYEEKMQDKETAEYKKAMVDGDVDEEPEETESLL